MEILFPIERLSAKMKKITTGFMDLSEIIRRERDKLDWRTFHVTQITSGFACTGISN